MSDTSPESSPRQLATDARDFRAWRSFQPGTNLRAWLFRILTNLNIDRGRKVQRTPDTQPLEETDYFLYNKLEESTSDQNLDERRVGCWPSSHNARSPRPPPPPHTAGDGVDT